MPHRDNEKAKKYQKARYERLKTQILEKQKKYNLEHANEKAEYDRKRYQSNKDKIIENVRKYREKNLGKIRAYDRKRSKLSERKEKAAKYSKQHPEKRRKYSSEWYYNNHEKAVEVCRNWRKRNMKKCHAMPVLRKYGLSMEDYEKMNDVQQGACAICGCKPTRRLSVDHDHKTGKVRGLLCVRCNTSVDWALEFHEKTLEYIKNAEQR